MGIQEKIKEIEEEMKRTQKNKATEYHLGVLKAKMAKLRRELITPKGKGGGGGGGGGFDVRKSGDASVAIIGFPSVGKSTLLNKLTNAESKMAAYAFTTLKCIPGILEYKGAKIQMLDLPGIIRGATQGKGRGREIISVARNSDLILIMLEATHLEHYATILEELEGFGIRLNKLPPKIVVRKLERGGVTIDNTVKLTRISKEAVLAVLNEYSYYSAEVVFRSDSSIDEFIDIIEGNRAYIPSLVVVNKIDLLPKSTKLTLPPSYLPISAEKGKGMDELKARIFAALRLMKIYTKRKGEAADMDEPLIVRSGITVAEVCSLLHRDLLSQFKYALVWGKSVKHPGQHIGTDHVLQDGDLIQIVKK